MSKLTLTHNFLGWDDNNINSNPVRTPINWSRTLTNIPVDVPSTTEYWIPALSSQTLFDGSRTTLIDNTTAFSLVLSSLDPTHYRITNTGGTAPGFRTNRSVVVTSIALTLAVLPNLSMSVTAGSGTPFSAVQVGDNVFIPGLSTGDGSGPFNELNTGFWSVIAQTSTVLTLTRFPNTVFSGISEVVTPSSNSQFIAYSSAGIQVGDMVDINAGFSVANQGTFEVLTVTPSFIEILSTQPLGAQTGITPTNSGMQFYSSAKLFVHIEFDQNCVVQFNGDTSNFNRLTPFIPGDPNNVGHVAKVGPSWKGVIVNKSTVTLHVTLISAE